MLLLKCTTSFHQEKLCSMITLIYFIGCIPSASHVVGKSTFERIDSTRSLWYAISRLDRLLCCGEYKEGNHPVTNGTTCILLLLDSPLQVLSTKAQPNTKIVVVITPEISSCRAYNTAGRAYHVLGIGNTLKSMRAAKARNHANFPQACCLYCFLGATKGLIDAWSNFNGRL
jgi:hypothetical protein